MQTIPTKSLSRSNFPSRFFLMSLEFPPPRSFPPCSSAVSEHTNMFVTLSYENNHNCCFSLFVLAHNNYFFISTSLFVCTSLINTTQLLLIALKSSHPTKPQRPPWKTCLSIDLVSASGPYPPSPTRTKVCSEVKASISKAQRSGPHYLVRIC